MENQIEQVDLIQTQIMGLKELAQMVAVIDTCASRGTFKAEEFSTIGRLREIIIAESQAQAQIRQAAQQQELVRSLGSAAIGSPLLDPKKQAEAGLISQQMDANANQQEQPV